MRQIGADRCRHDDGDGGADTELDAHLFGYAKQTKYFIKRRHDDRPAADAEQAGEHSGNDAGNDNSERKPEKLSKRDAE